MCHVVKFQVDVTNFKSVEEATKESKKEAPEKTKAERKENK